jgi:predicted metal-binding membrane protein
MRALNRLPEVDEVDDVHLIGPVVARPWVQAYWPWALVACAWGAVLLAMLTSHSALVDHDWLLERSGLSWFVALTLFLTSWQVMIAAMMVPSTLPVLQRDLRGVRGKLQLAQVIFLVGYFLVWTWFAAAAFLADTSIHVLVETWPWLSQHTEVIGATTLALAGIFQFSPLKRASLTACRSPLGSTARRDSVTVGIAWRSGLHHGLTCLGSGWALMLVMFGLGVGGVGWMLALTGVMVVEKDLPGGRWLTPAVGITLLALAVVWWVHPGWLPSAGV